MEEQQKGIETVGSAPEVVETPARDVEAKPEQKEETEEKITTPEETEEKITTPITQKKDPKKVEAGRLSAISRAAKKRQREQLGVEEEKSTHSYWNPSSILYFGVPSIVLLGMFLWTIREKKAVIEYKPVEKTEGTEQRLPDSKKKRDTVGTVSLFE